jgi:hypothetical protein
MALDPGFAPLLEGMRVDALDADPATIVGFWVDGRIGYFNAAYQTFATAGGDAELCARWGLGANVFDATPKLLLPFYEELFQRASTAQAPLSHRYECPSPSLARTFSMRLHPLGNGRALLASHAIVLARPHDQVWAADEARYRDEFGIIRQCVHCRCVQAIDAGNWELVPAYVAEMPDRTSHGICGVCVEYHYGEVGRERG